MSRQVSLHDYLAELARSARPGDRLPTIRELMRRFGASQMAVQRAFQVLKTQGLIDAHVGRGTYFRGGTAPEVAVQPSSEPVAPGAARGAGDPASRSVLLLRRSISIARGRALMEGVQQRLVAEGHRVLELSYTDPDHALAVLRGLPRLDACVVQSTYRTIPIALLAALKERSDVVAIDGAALVGADVEAVGTEWGEPLAAAVALLQRAGHTRIAYAGTSLPFLATQLGRRRFQALKAQQAHLELFEISVPLSPDQAYADAVVEQVAALRADGVPPFTALVAWGIEDGARLREKLDAIGLPVPAMLSVVLLGRTDLANEHDGFFHVVGCSVSDQVQALMEALQSRWADPHAPHGVRLTPVTTRDGSSVAPPRATIPPPRARAPRSPR